MSDCTKTEELLAAYADGGLDGDEARLVGAHLSACARCRGEVEAMRDLLAVAGSRPVPERDEKLWTDMAREIRVAYDTQAKRTSWFRRPIVMGSFAAAASIVLVVGLLRLGKTPATHAPKPHELVAQATPKPKHDLAIVDENDLTDDEVREAHADLDADDEADTEDDAAQTEPSDDDALAADAASTNDVIENLSDEEIARVYADLQKT
jgi:hypothetical protein